MRFWEVFFMMLEKTHKRRRKEKFAKKAKSQKVNKEKHTQDISPMHNLFIIPSALIYLWKG